MATDSPRPGRKRDGRLDGVILDAALAVLAERGYDGTTIDLVAARANSARATVYRRWPTKAELVLAAVTQLSTEDAGAGEPLDTGSLRGDMLATILPLSEDEQQMRIRAMVALMHAGADLGPALEAATRSGIEPWITLNRRLIQRAVDRGEFRAPGDLDALAEVMPMMCIARAAQRLAITRAFAIALIDGVVLPALRGGSSASQPAPTQPRTEHPPERTPR